MKTNLNWTRAFLDVSMLALCLAVWWLVYLLIKSAL